MSIQIILVGVMDHKQVKAPFFFKLKRENS